MTPSMTSSYPSPDEIFDVAVSRAAARGYRLGSGASQEFHAAASRAASEIAQDADPVPRTELARANFERMVDEMIAAIPRIPQYSINHPDEIGEFTLHEARLQLCPIWPFCD